MSALITAFAYFMRAILTIRGRAVTVVRIVVVQRSGGVVHVTRIVRVPSVR